MSIGKIMAGLRVLSFDYSDEELKVFNRAKVKMLCPFFTDKCSFILSTKYGPDALVEVDPIKLILITTPTVSIEGSTEINFTQWRYGTLCDLEEMIEFKYGLVPNKEAKKVWDDVVYKAKNGKAKPSAENQNVSFLIANNSSDGNGMLHSNLTSLNVILQGGIRQGESLIIGSQGTIRPSLLFTDGMLTFADKTFEVGSGEIGGHTDDLSELYIEVTIHEGDIQTTKTLILGDISTDSVEAINEATLNMVKIFLDKHGYQIENSSGFVFEAQKNPESKNPWNMVKPFMVKMFGIQETFNFIMGINVLSLDIVISE